MERVHVAGVGMTRFGKDIGISLKKLVGEAVSDALRDSDIDASRVQTAYFGSAIVGSMTRQEMIPGQVFLRPQGIQGIPIFNVENACASASTALHLAWQAVTTGQVDVALAVGAEKMTGVPKEQTLDAISRAVDVEEMELATSREDEGGRRTAALDPYAKTAKKLMDSWGASQQDFAAIAAKNHTMGAANPLAQYGAEMTLEEVLSSREVIWPLTLLMCCPISDGAAAAVLVSSEIARNLDRACPTVRASVMLSGSEAQDGIPRKAAKIASTRAFEQADVSPADLDCVEVHDAAAPAELEAYETLGLAGSGEEAVRLIRDEETSIGGRIPVNTSGGLLARGHPVGATGIAQVCEVVWQLTGRASARQIEGARLALTHNSGGWLQGDNAAVCIHIFSV